MSDAMRKYLRDYRARLYAHRKANRLCGDCGAQLPKQWRGVRCDGCQTRNRNYARKRLGWSKARIARTPARGRR